MKKIVFSLIFVLTFVACFSQKKATTEDGQVVLLYDNGTWKSAVELKINTEARVMEAPPFKGQIAVADSKSKIYALTQLSVTKNNITDEADWFLNNQLKLPEYEVPNSFMGTIGNMPDKTPKSYNGEKLVRSIYSDKYNFFIYGKDFSCGRYLLITDTKLNSVLHFLDFQNYVMSPDYVKADRMFIEQRISWATIEDTILYLAHGHSTYAASSKNMNAYITAINLTNYKILWRTKPLVNNSANFELYGDMIICGYGFTAEPDFLYTLDKRTGAVVQTLPLKSGPSCIIRKDDKVFVRTYNMDYVFKIK